MKMILKKKKMMLCALAFSLLVCLLTVSVSFAAEDSFERKIAAFPESYKPYLRELHKAHPSWEFEPFFTQLDFNASVDSEGGKKSLVSSSVSSELFKSKDIGDYDYSTNKYIQKDVGFVEANRLAVAYFMDPRNFLNEDGIFMFETLSFSNSFTVESVENVLKGSFMANKKITYYDKEGNLKKTSTKYSQAILDAGKKHNVNPCYLASKILNEVGTQGSKSVTGTHTDYPGIYNFYNIGAYDGSNPIKNGLKWASDEKSKTYGRPWTTPAKSISGGAQFIASTYIAGGQFTGYLQRFNVNPNGKYNVYDHQYMTNLTGALSQGYSTYVSYVKSGLIDNKYVFSIPVYENMPCWTTTADRGELTDAFEQTGKINVDTSYVRTGPSTSNAKLTNAAGNAIRLGKGAVVSIDSKVKTDSAYYASILEYPYWYKISFTQNGVSYIGYVPVTFVDISTVVQVPVGEYEPSFITTSYDVDMHLVSYDARIANITSDNKIKFLRNGTVTVAAYDSTGSFDTVKYVVGSGASSLSDARITAVKSNYVTLDFTSLKAASGYEIIAVDERGNISYRNIVKAPPCTVSISNGVPDSAPITKVQKNTDGSVTIRWQAPEGTENRIYVRAVFENSSSAKNYGPVKCLYATSTVDGYKLYSGSGANGELTELQTLPSTYSSYNILPANVKDGRFALCAFGTVQGEPVYGSMSSVADMNNIPDAVKGLKLSDVTESGYTIRWTPISGVKYYIYKKNGNKYDLVKSLSEASYTVSKRKTSEISEYKIMAVKAEGGIVYEGLCTNPFTATTRPSKVEDFKISASDVGGKLTWKAVENATSYDLYIYNEKSKKYEKFTNVTKTTYTLKGKSASKEYKLRIVPLIKTSLGTYKGEKAGLTFLTKPGKVKEIKASSVGTSSFKLSWDKTKGTSRYYVYQYDSKKKKYVKVADLKTNTFTPKNLKAGTTYKFKIKTVKLVNGKSVCSNTSSVFSFTTKPGKVSGVKASSVKGTSLTLKWSKVTGAGKYQVYIYDGKKKDYKRIATVDGKTSYTVKSLKADKSYKFRVRAVRTLNDKSYYGSKSSVYTVRTKK